MQKKEQRETSGDITKEHLRVQQRMEQIWQIDLFTKIMSLSATYSGKKNKYLDVLWVWSQTVLSLDLAL